jgi:hypothetical protein
MKKLGLLTWLIVLSCLLFGFAGCGLFGDDDDDDSSTSMTSLSGERTADITLGGSPYVMRGDVTIPDGANVTIESGVEIFVKGDYVFKVEGQLDARGMEDAFITFTSGLTMPDRGDWKGIWLDGADDGTILEYVKVEYANKYNLIDDTTRYYDHENNGGTGIIYDLLMRGAITVKECTPTIRRCIIDKGGYDGIHVIGGVVPGTMTSDTVNIEFNTIVGNAFNAIRVEPHWVKFWDGEANSIPFTKISNNILVENDDAGIRLPDRIGALYSGGLIPTMLYNNIWNNVSLDYVPGEFSVESDHSTDIHRNPYFVDFEGGDYHLHPCSGVIDASDPNNGMTDPDGTTRDLGALPLYQNVTDLSKVLKGSKLVLNANTDYHITCNTYVEEGDLMTVGAGARIFFDGPYSLIVKGNIEVDGTTSNPVLFTSNQDEPARGDWRQIVLANVDNSFMRNVVIEYASVENTSKAEFDTLGALSILGCSPALDNITIRESYWAGLYLSNGSSPVINKLEVDGANTDGIIMNLNCSPTVTDLLIRNTDRYGLMLVNNSFPVISNALIYNVTVSGMVVESSRPTVDHMTLYGKSLNESGFTNFIYYAVRSTNNSSPVNFTNSVFAEFKRAAIVSQVSSLTRLTDSNIYTSYTPESDESAPVNFIQGTDGSVEHPGLVEGNPLFVNPDEGNFTIPSSSPAAGMGADGWPLGR